MKQFKLIPMYKIKFFITLMVMMTLMFVFSLSAKSQNVKLEGRTFVVEQNDSAKGGKYTKTEYTYQDKTGTYPIYLSSRGSAFIFKVSKKTGKEYRKYLPEVTKKLGTKKDKEDDKR